MTQGKRKVEKKCKPKEGDNKMKFRIIFVTALALGISLYGLGGANTYAASIPAGKTIKVGVFVDLTGFLSSRGIPESEGAKLAVKHLNELGGVRGHKIELKILDTRSSVDQAVIQFQKLADDPAIVVALGPIMSGATMLVRPFAAKARLPFSAWSAGTPITEGPYKEWEYTFTQGPSWDQTMCRAEMKFMKDTLGVKKVGMLVQNEAFGLSGAKVFEKFAPEYGFKIVGRELHGQKDTDVTPQLAILKSKKPDAVWSFPSGIVNVIIYKNYRALGMQNKIPICGPQNYGETEIIKAAGQASVGGIFMSVLAAEDPDPTRPGFGGRAQPEICAEWLKLHGYPASDCVVDGYEGIQMVVATLEKIIDAGGDPFDGATFKEAMETLDIMSLGGPLRWSKTNHRGHPVEAFGMSVVDHNRRRVRWEHRSDDVYPQFKKGL